jgi:hypothetical protein
MYGPHYQGLAASCIACGENAGPAGSKVGIGFNSLTKAIRLHFQLPFRSEHIGFRLREPERE